MFQHFLFITTILIIKNLWISSATLYPHISNVRRIYKSEASTSPIIQHATEITGSNFKNINQYENKLVFHNSISKKRFVKEDNNSVTGNQSNVSRYGLYYPQTQIEEGNTVVNNDLNCIDQIFQKECNPKKQFQQKQVNGNQLFMLKLLENKTELNKVNLDYREHLYQQMAPSKNVAKNSNDYFKAQNLTAYVTPSPSYTEMHLDLHHQQQLNDNIGIETIVSHATGSEASPITATSLKSYKLYYNTQNVFKTATQTGSNQYNFAPKRSFNEKELSQNSNILPYPPSFISITTTERSSSTVINHKPIVNKLPDLFLNRQHKSLWDSYIPSWEITKMFQQFQNKKEFHNTNNNLHTLVLIKRVSN